MNDDVSHSDLEVDAEILGKLYQDLGEVKETFDGIEDHTDATAGLWCDGSVRDAMDEFSSNMDHNRKELSDKIKEVRDKVKSTVETWGQAEDDLASQFDKGVAAEARQL